jgi:predicted nucleic acid-binding protein
MEDFGSRVSGAAGEFPGSIRTMRKEECEAFTPRTLFIAFVLVTVTFSGRNIDNNFYLMYHRHMNIVPKLFLETSVFNFYVDGKQGQKQQETQKLFAAIKSGKYEAYTSTAVTEELTAAPKAKFDAMNGLIKQYVKEVFDPDVDSKSLADMYVAKHIIPPKSWDDGLHIAVATVENLDFVVSCNMGHIDKRKTMIGTGFINLRAGYKNIGICSSMEVMDYAVGRVGAHYIILIGTRNGVTHDK